MNTHFFKNNLAILFAAFLVQIILKDFLLSVSNNFLILGIDVLPLLWLPFSTPRLFTLIYGFVIGFIMDIICFTPGLSMAIFVSVAFVRSFVLNLLLRNNAIDKRPSVAILGFSLYIGYLLLMFGVYFLMFYALQYWDIKVWFKMMGNILFNVILNMLMVLLFDFFFFSARNKHSSIV